MSETTETKARYGMVIDLDRCNGCGACMVACAVENNIPAVPAAPGDRKGITWIRVYRVRRPEGAGPGGTAFIPVPCQHCGAHTPCLEVCPQSAVDLDPETGIVGTIPQRCLGCRYCMAACPYHARYFNWWDPVWPGGMDKTLNPRVSPRMRGVVEKCTFCHARLQEARRRAATTGRRNLREGEYVPACAEACPMQAITFGDLSDRESEVSRLASNPDVFQLLGKLGTEPKIHYISRRSWVRRMAENGPASIVEERGGQAAAK